MTLNELMHPRNPYRQKPDFKALALKHPQFREFATTDLKGKVHLDFKSPGCLRALSWVLLKNDWDLDVHLPPDRLIPTIPLRLNYILWLEDLLGDEEDIRGIDIGAGASCIYALLGAKKNKWNFVTTEADEISYNHAKENVEKNGLSDKISVVKVEYGDRLKDILEREGDKTFSFCMTNPPFFANYLEAWSRNENRSEPNSTCTAAPSESFVPGGEVDFVKKMIKDSLNAKSKVRIYSAMLGKKTSLLPIREELQRHKITNFGITEFCQGRTMRWGIGWTFSPDIKFPKRPSQLRTANKPKPPISYRVPLSEDPGFKYDVLSIGRKVMEYLNELKMIYEIEKSSNVVLELQAVALENTWINTRRKRRKMMRDLAILPQKIKKTAGETTQSGSPDDGEANTGPASTDYINDEKLGKVSKVNEEVKMDGSCQQEKESVDGEGSKNNSLPEKKEVGGDTPENMSTEGSAPPSQEEIDRMNMSVEEVEEYLLKFSLSLKKEGAHIILSLTLQGALGIDLLHQLLQYFKNRLK